MTALLFFQGNSLCQKMWPQFGLEFECAVYQITVITWLQRRISAFSCNFFHSQRQIKVSTWHFSPGIAVSDWQFFNVLLQVFHDGLWGLSKKESKNMWELVKSQCLRSKVLFIKFSQIYFCLNWDKSSEAGIVNVKVSSGHLPAPFALLSVFRSSSSYVYLLILPQLRFLKVILSLIL